jgi:hypothetical protein
MRTVSSSLWIVFTLLSLVFCREIYFQDFEYFPTESEFIDYGSLKVSRTKNRTIFFLRGNFTISRDVGNDKPITLELWKDKGLLLRSIQPFCTFVRGDNIFWPELVNNSNMPSPQTCPFPAVYFLIFKRLK